MTESYSLKPCDDKWKINLRRIFLAPNWQIITVFFVFFKDPDINH
jgi:hypothetical protein